MFSEDPRSFLHEFGMLSACRGVRLHDSLCRAASYAWCGPWSFSGARPSALYSVEAWWPTAPKCRSCSSKMEECCTSFCRSMRNGPWTLASPYATCRSTRSLRKPIRTPLTPTLCARMTLKAACAEKRCAGRLAFHAFFAERGEDERTTCTACHHPSAKLVIDPPIADDHDAHMST